MSEKVKRLNGEKVKGEGLKRVVLNRNGQITAKAREVSDLKIGLFEVGQHVMLSITGDCCYHRKVFAEYAVTGVERVDRFGGRDRVTFDRVEKRTGARRAGNVSAAPRGEVKGGGK